MKRTGVIVGLLLCAVSSAAFASRLWSWVLNFDPGFVFNHRPVPTGAPLSSNVTILLVDGLRLDASRRMPTLNALRSRGADLEAQVGTPSFSRPGRATVAVGAPPSIHGVTTNRQKRALLMDNLIRRVGAMGGACRIAGSKIWSSLFGDDIARCGVYREGEGEEGPGAFVRQVGEVRASQNAGVVFVLEKPATLRIADIVSTDFAAHEYGGSSPEYQAEVSRADQTLAILVSRLDLSKETLVVVADHGHRDAGGHGGEEPLVLAIPMVMVGAGIKPGTAAKASQADLAPTIAALLGAALPAGASGRSLDSILQADEAKLALVKGASAAQKEAFNKAVGDRLGIQSTWNASADWTELVFVHRTGEKDARDPILVFLIVGLLSGVVAAAHFARPGAVGPMAGIAAGVVALLGPIGSRIPAMSFSAINYDEMLIPFFQRVIVLAVVTTLVAIVAGLLADRLLHRAPGAGSSSALAGVIGLMVTTLPGVLTVVAWWRYDLLSPLTLPGPDVMVTAFALTLSVLSASLTSLAAVAALWVMGSAGRGQA